jgi:glycosyltransferase involved in cell wall biosynthesis
MAVDLSVIILTYNEEVNIEQALESVAGWAKRVFVVDSFSRDRTLELARQYGAEIHQFEFKSYSSQRNRALDELPLDSEWILFLDADEWLPSGLKQEIENVLAGNPAEHGYFLKRRFYWMGAWIRRGYYPVWILRLFRRGHARCEDRQVNEHMLVDGATGFLQHDFIHEDRKSVQDWIEKHNRYAFREAQELLKAARETGALFGSQAERVRWLRESVYNRLPPVIRPGLFFFYRVFLRGGILDGWKALLYHFLQAFWYPLLIDIHFLELKRGEPAKPYGHPFPGRQFPS